MESSTAATLGLCAAVLLVPPSALAGSREDLHDGATPAPARESVGLWSEEARAGDIATATADEISFDARSQDVTLTGNVRVDAPPFHFTSDQVTVERTTRGIEIRGDGRVAFCPCAGTPLALHVKDATVAPPGDLLLGSPTVELYGAPVFWLPWFWLRAPSRVGLLPPVVAYRGRDGVFLGEGLHLPWNSTAAPRPLWPNPEVPPDRLVTLRAGGYLIGGARAEATYRTPESLSRVEWDYLREHGVAVDARGATTPAGLPPGSRLLGSRLPRASWDVDALVGRRAVLATSDLDPAARPYDHGRVEAFGDALGVTAASGVSFVAPRGATPFHDWALGPTVSLSRGGAIGDLISYDAAMTGGTLGHGEGSLAPRNVTFARGAARAEAAFVAGPTSLSLAGRGLLDGVAAAAGDASDELVNRVADARARVALPLGRAYGTERDPWVHRIEPEIAVATMSVHEETALVLGPGFSRGAPLRGTAVIAEAGLLQAAGRWASRQALELDLRAGAVTRASEVQPAARARATAGFDVVGVGVEAAHVLGGRTAEGGSGTTAIARARFGRREGPSLGLRAALRDEDDPVLARALVDPATDPASGFLSSAGVSAGASLVYPWSKIVTTAAHADYDVTHEELLFARGALTLRDACGCLGVTATGGKRLGREGVDVWLTVLIGAARTR